MIDVFYNVIIEFKFQTNLSRVIKKERKIVKKMVEYDLLILGAGTSGLPTARVAASAGKKVLLIGEKPIGGKCINYGCTPTKALVYATKLYKEAVKAIV